MKLITLNIWGGRVLEPLLQFAQTKLQEADIICLQEVYSSALAQAPEVRPCTNSLQQLSSLLPDYAVVYAPSVQGIFPEQYQDPSLDYGNGMFVRKGFKVKG